MREQSGRAHAEPPGGEERATYGSVRTPGRWVPPPNWPAPPAGWTPPEGWRPDAAWGPPPPGWEFWPDGPPSEGSWIRRHKVLTGVGAVLALGLVSTAIGDDSDTTTVSVTARPVASSSPSPSPTPSPFVSPSPAVDLTGTTRPADASGPYPVVEVVDGDTVLVLIDGAATSVRLIGLDAPETRDPRTVVQCFGREAAARAGQLLTGQQVWLEYDATQGRLDQYGRTLAYAWTSAGLYNKQMVAEGFAHEHTSGVPHTYQAVFTSAEAAARNASRGFWSPASCAGDTTRAADPVPAVVAPPPPAPAPPPTTRAVTPPRTRAPAPPPATRGSTYYANCTAARTAGVTPLRRGDPGYARHLDRDDDGVACE